MKRALLVLLLLAVAGGLFAQSITFGGFARSGLMVAVPDEGDTTFHAYNPDPGNRLRFELNVTTTRADGNAGANGRFRLNTDLEGVSSLANEWAYAWYRPIGDAVTNGLTIYGGKMDNNNWSPAGGFDVSGDVGSGAVGALLRYDVAGLSLGAGIYPTAAEFGDGTYKFGLKYTMPGLLVGAANFIYTGAAKGGDGQTDVNAGVDITALSGLGFSKLAVDVRAVDLSDLLWLGIGPRVHFAFGDISGGLRSQVYLPMGDSTEDLDLAATVWGQIPFGAITARLDVGYELNAGLKAANSDNSFEYRAWDGLPRAIGGGDDSLLILSPRLIFNIGGGTIEAGYSLLTQLGDNAKTKHAIFSTFNVGF